MCVHAPTRSVVACDFSSPRLRTSASCCLILAHPTARARAAVLLLNLGPSRVDAPPPPVAAAGSVRRAKGAAASAARAFRCRRRPFGNERLLLGLGLVLLLVLVLLGG